MQKTITTPQKPILCDKVMQYLDNHFSINVNKQCVIMKVDNVDTFPKEIRSWLIDVLSVGNINFSSVASNTLKIFIN